MTRSVNEVEVMVVKACRGANVPLAQAQDVARVAACHPGTLPTILKHLAAAMPQPTLDTSHGLVVSNVHVLRDLPVAVDAVNAGVSPVRLIVQSDDFLETYCIHHGVSARSNSGAVDLILGSRNVISAKRCEISDDIWAQLNVFASHTYVPETDESRLVGAGAGLTDND
ncbi:MAG: hypothetical protein ACPGRD_01310 [Planktomarina sp.]